MTSASPPVTYDTIIVGAGLAGLAAALRLQGAGRQILVLEAGDGVGGRVRTDLVEGFRLDRGFQILLTAYPEAQRVLDLDALALRPFTPGAVVRWNGGFHRLVDPFRRPLTLPATARSRLIPLGDKLRVAALRRRVTRGDGSALLRAPETSTLEHLRTLGFSEATIDRLFRPLFGGIQLDPSLATSSRMFDVIYRSLALGDSAVPADGMGAIPLRLSARLPDGTVQLNRRVTAVDGSGVSVDGERIEATSVIVATDGAAAAELLGRPDVASHAVSCCWFAAPCSPLAEPVILLDGDGTGPAMNVAMMSEVAPSYAPAGHALIAAAAPGIHGDELAAATTAQLRGWFGAQVDEWRLLRVDHIARAQPAQLPPFHPKRPVRVSDGLFVVGDHRDTASIQGALFSGRRCADAVLGR